MTRWGTVLLVVTALTAAGMGLGAQVDDRACADFDTQEDAQEFYEEQGGPDTDPHGLDPDGDGIACEETGAAAADESPEPEETARVLAQETTPAPTLAPTPAPTVAPTAAPNASPLPRTGSSTALFGLWGATFVLGGLALCMWAAAHVPAIANLFPSRRPHVRPYRPKQMRVMQAVVTRAAKRR